MTGREKQEQDSEHRQSGQGEERRRPATGKPQDRDEDRLDEDKLDEVLRDCPL
jgi:hypothetical protein